MLSVKTNIDSFIKTTLANHRKQIHYAGVLANTRLASAISKEEKIELARILDRPTPWILKAFRMRAATKSKPQSAVYVTDDYKNAKGSSHADILAPHIFGKRRNVKRFEERLRDKNYLGNGSYVVPAGGAVLNKYGNVKSGQITQILSVLGAHTESGFTANTTANSRKRNKKLPNLFVIKEGQGSHLAPGIWKRKQRSIVPLFVFIKQPDYNQRFDFYGIAQRVAQREYPKIYEQALKDAKATAR